MNLAHGDTSSDPSDSPLTCTNTLSDPSPIRGPIRRVGRPIESDESDADRTRIGTPVSAGQRRVGRVGRSVPACESTTPSDAPRATPSTTVAALAEDNTPARRLARRGAFRRFLADGTAALRPWERLPPRRGRGRTPVSNLSPNGDHPR